MFRRFFLVGIALLLFAPTARAAWVDQCDGNGGGTTSNSVLDECPSGVGGYVRAPNGSIFCSTGSDASGYCYYGPAGSTTGEAYSQNLLGCIAGGIGTNTCTVRTTEDPEDRDCIRRIANCGVAAPGSVTATGKTGKITISWGSSGGGTSFTVKRGTSSTSFGTTIASGISGFTRDDTTAVAGTRYYYVVTATNSYGTSGNSSVVSAYALAKPTLSSAVAGDAQVTLTWTAVTGASGYSIKERTSPTGAITTISPGNVTTYIRNGRTNGTTYYYEVTATNTIGPSASDLSNQLLATPQVPIPAAPTGFTVTIGNAKANLTWLASTGATSYTLRRGRASGGPYSDVAGATNTTSLSFTDTGLTNNPSPYYYYVVVANNAAGTSANSVEKAAAPIATPILSTSAGSSSVKLDWAFVPGSTGGYTIRRRTSPTGTVTTISITSGTTITHTDGGLANGTTYYYEIAAISATGTGEYSAQVTATPIAAPVLVRTAIGDAKASFSWAAITGATSYTLKQGTVSGGPYTDVAGATNTTSLTFTHTGLTNNTLYYYVVVANNSNGFSNNSNQVSAQPIQTPTITSIVAGTLNATIEWTSSPGATSYTLRYGTTAAMTSTPITGLTTTKYTKTSLLNNTLYYFAIAAVNGTGTGENSNQVTATPINAPTSLAKTIGDNKVSLTWVAPVGTVTSYTVKRSLSSAMTNPTSFDAGTSLSYTDTTAQNNTLYYYVVVANNSSGFSNDSTQVSAQPIQTPTVTVVAGTLNATLTWNASPGAMSYTLRYGTTAAMTSTAILNVTSPYVKTSLLNNTLYYFAIAAVNATGTGENSNQVTATPINAPTSVVGAPNNNAVSLTWVAPVGTVTSYTVKRGTASTGPFSAVGTGVIGTSFVDYTALNGTTYYYVVVAHNSSGFSNDSTASSGVMPSISIPAAPTLTAAGYETRIRLNWSAPSQTVTGYTVKRSAVSGSGYTNIASLAGNVLTYDDTSLSTGATYYYVVVASNTFGSSTFSNEASGTTTAAPGRATNLTATGITDAISLTWTTPTSGTVTRYEVRRSQNPNFEYDPFNFYPSGCSYAPVNANATCTAYNAGSATSYTDTAVLSGNRYYYYVVAYNVYTTSLDSLPNRSSGPYPNAVPISIPSVPTNLTANSATSSQLTLSWTASTGATSYTLKRSTSPGGSPTPYANVATGITGTSYVNSGLTNGTTYYYVVVAVNGSGTSGNSNEASATPVAAPVLSAVAGDGQVVLSWNTITGATGYTVRRSQNATGGQPYTNIAAGVATTTYTNSGLTNGTTYYYVVVAGSATVSGSNSNEASATPVAVPAAPANLTAIPGNAQITLSWNASAGAASYSLQRSLTANGVTTTIPVGNVTSYPDTGLTNGQAYYYVVVAINAAGTSPKSNKVSATPQVPSSIVLTLAPTPSRCSQATVPATTGVIEVKGSLSVSGGFPPYTVAWSPTPFWMSTTTSPQPFQPFLATYRYSGQVQTFATTSSAPVITATITDAAFGTASTTRNVVPCPVVNACVIP